MNMNRFCGIGSCTCSSVEEGVKRRELRLARHGKTIRGKLIMTVKAKPIIGMHGLIVT